MSYPHAMADLYRALADQGLDRRWVQRVVLSDEWRDAHARTEEGRALVEAWLQDALCLEDQPPVVFEPAESASAGVAAVIRSVAAAAAGARVSGRDPWIGPMRGTTLRESLLSEHRVVRLASLAEVCWTLGVMVLPLRQLPVRPASVRFAAASLFAGNVPVIVLGDQDDAPPFALWHIARQLGCLLSPGGDGVPFAEALMTPPGAADSAGPVRITGVKLAALAREQGRSQVEDSGNIVVRYVRHQASIGEDGRGPARRALKLLGMDQGASALLGQIAQSHLDVGRVSLAAGQVLSRVCLLG